MLSGRRLIFERLESRVALTTGLTHHYPFDVDAGDTVGGNDGSLIGGASIVRDAERGLVLNLDGINDYVSLAAGNTPSGPTDSIEFTIAAWLKMPPGFTAEKNGGGIYGEYWTGDSSSRNFLTGANEKNRHLVFDQWPRDSGHFHGTTPLNDDAWHHIAYVQELRDGVVRRQAYVDGVLDAFDDAAEPYYGPDPNLWAIGARLGSHPQLPRYTRGRLDDIRFYDRALSADEISSLARDQDDGTTRVSSLEPTTTGFRVTFSGSIDTTTLNLYSSQASQMGPSDVTLVSSSGQLIGGSLIVDPTLQDITFVKTAGPLAADTYTVSLRSGPNGFIDVGGNALDGDANGIPGGDFVATFHVAPRQADSRVLSIPDFVRGPGQEVSLPASLGNGIPLSISDGMGVRAVDLQLNYDPTLLEITAAKLADDTPEGALVVVNDETPGLLILTFASPTALPAGKSTFAYLEARVPVGDTGPETELHLLDLHSITVSDGNDNEFPAVDDDGVHLAAFFGDVSGNGRINANDASLIARVSVFLDSGFAAWPTVDPLIVADITGNGRINASDTSKAARVAAMLPVPEIPALPTVGGRIVVAHDVNTLSTSLAGDQEAQFAVNVASWLLDGVASGRLLLVESAGDEVKNDFAPGVKQALEEAGFTLQFSGNHNLTAGQLNDFDAVFVGMSRPEGDVPDSDVLENYVRSGGGLYVFGGVDGFLGDAEAWNPFLQRFGLEFLPGHETPNRELTPITSHHPVFVDVTALQSGAGNFIVDLVPDDSSQIIETYDGAGIFAVYDPMPRRPLPMR